MFKSETKLIILIVLIGILFYIFFLDSKITESRSGKTIIALNSNYESLIFVYNKEHNKAEPLLYNKDKAVILDSKNLNTYLFIGLIDNGKLIKTTIFLDLENVEDIYMYEINLELENEEKFEGIVSVEAYYNNTKIETILPNTTIVNYMVQNFKEYNGDLEDLIKK